MAPAEARLWWTERAEEGARGAGVTGRGPVRGAARSDDATALYLGLRCGKEIESGGRWPTSELVAPLRGGWESNLAVVNAISIYL